MSNYRIYSIQTIYICQMDNYSNNNRRYQVLKEQNVIHNIHTYIYIYIYIYIKSTHISLNEIDLK